MQLLSAERDRAASVRPDEAVGFESFEKQLETVAAPADILMRSRRRLPNTNSVQVIGFRRIACSTRIDSPLMPTRF